MTNRVSEYRIHNTTDADPAIIQDAIDTLNNLGKSKVYPYGNGQVCFHHKGDYFFVSPYTFKWAPRHRANQKWRQPRNLSIKGCFEDINGWCEYKKRKSLEDSK